MDEDDEGKVTVYVEEADGEEEESTAQNSTPIITEIETEAPEENIKVDITDVVPLES